MEVKMNPISPSVLAECSLNRATSYVTTNGMIQVTLCGLFATTIAVLVALAEQTGSSSSPVIYSFVIPAFSFVILTVSLNVYSWITEQLTYLDWFGRSDSQIIQFRSFEEFLELTNGEWNKTGPVRKLWYITWKSFTFYALMPFRFNNIYCYYFFLYIVTPIVGIVYNGGVASIWPAVPIVIAIQLFLIGTGLRGFIVLNRVQSAVKTGLSDTLKEDVNSSVESQTSTEEITS